MAAEREKLYECEVKRRRVRAGGGYEPFWKVKNVVDALMDADTEFRCKDCAGEVKLFRSHKAGGPAPHVEHKQKTQSIALRACTSAKRRTVVWRGPPATRSRNGDAAMRPGCLPAGIGGIH